MTNKIILLLLLLFGLFACENREVEFEEPACNSEFKPYDLYSNLYNNLEDENDFWDEKKYYTICKSSITINPIKFEDNTILYFSPNSVSEKKFIRISNKKFIDDEYSDIFDIKFDSLIAIPGFAHRPYFIDLYSNNFKSTIPIQIEIGVNLYYHSSNYPHNVSIYDISIYKINVNTNKVIYKLESSKSEMIDIDGFDGVSGIVSAEISEMGTYIAAVPISKSNLPKVKGGWINATQKIGVNEKILNYNSLTYNGAAFINKKGQEPFTVLIQEIFSNNYEIKGRAQIFFKGNTTGTYTLNEQNIANFSYIESGELKYFSTTGKNGKIVITKYGAIGDNIEGYIEMSNNTGGTNNDGENIIITANFSLKHRTPWNYESN